MVDEFGRNGHGYEQDYGYNPLSIRRKYGIKEGDKVQFVEVDGAIMMIPLKSLSEMQGMDKAHSKALFQGVRELNREHRKEARG